MNLKLLSSFGLFFVMFGSINAQNYTWTEDVAPIIYEHCSSCHHEGAIGPFNLMSLEDVIDHSESIYHVVSERTMPPWPADPNYRHFTGEAYLADEEIDGILEWIDNDFPIGDPLNEPEPPIFLPNGSLLESIDHTFIVDSYTLQSNEDEYRYFVFENPFSETVYIQSVEVFPGLETVVHHADLFTDNSQATIDLDALDPLPGFSQSIGSPNLDQYINAWQPGANVLSYPNNWGFEVLPNTNFVFEIHYGPGGIGQTDITKMNIQFVKEPESFRQIKASWMMTDGPAHLIDGPLYIPANEVVEFHQEVPVPNDLSLIAICPHMHLIGKSYRVWCETPEGDSIPLIDIPRWDFHWQKYYQFRQVQKIPAGSILKSEGVYDNTLANHDQPNNPPIDIWRGQTTEDEMFLCYMIFSDYQIGDEDIVLDSTLLISSSTLITEKNHFHVFPNPVSQTLNIKFKDVDNTASKISVLSVTGNLLKNIHIPIRESELQIDVQDLNEGAYYLKWYNEQHSSVHQFVKF